MNPLKPLLDSFDHFINEHGSANILKERLALASDQYAFLEQQFAALKSENEILKTENKDLKAENKRFKLDNDNLKKKIDEYENANPFGPGMVQESQFKHLP
jgi:regulator of replication initiation timing